MLLALILSVAVGVSLGLLGGGGSILTVPILVYVVGLETKPAIATSLLVVGATSVSALLAHARAGRVDYRLGGSFGLASMLGAFGGGSLAHLLPSALLLAGFTAVMFVTGVVMLRPRREPGTAPPRSSLARTALVGVLVGALTGLVGAGGGFVVVPALVMLLGLSMEKAIATSLLVIAMNSFAAFAGHVGHVSIDVRTAGFVTAAAIAGSLAGAWLAGRIPAASLRGAFAVLVLAMAAFMAVQQLPPTVRQQALRDPRVTHLVAASLGALLTVIVLRLRRHGSAHAEREHLVTASRSRS